MLNRRKTLFLAAGAALLVAGPAWAQDLPKLEQKDRYKVGFAQTESNNPWRIAEMAGEVLRGGKRFREIVPKRRGWRYRLRELLDENLLR